MTLKLYSKRNLQFGSLAFGAGTVVWVLMTIFLPNTADHIVYHNTRILRGEPDFDRVMKTWQYLMGIGTLVPLGLTLFCIKKGFLDKEQSVEDEH